MDAAANFAKSVVSTGYDETALTVTLDASDPNLSRWPDPATVGPYNATWWDATTYADPADDPNVEIVRVTAKSGAQLTVTRAQEGTVATAKDTSGSAYKMVVAPTKKLIDDLQESQIDSGTAYGWITDAPYNAEGDGTTDDHDAFEDAAAALTTIVVPSGTYRIASSLTIGSGVSLHMLEGAQFSIDAGATVTVNGNIIAGNYQIWGGSGALTLSSRQLIRYERWDGTASDAVNLYGDFEVLSGYLKVSGKRQTGGTAAPASGTWALGDICWNTGPATTEYVGWICTVAGTPGTWLGFGVINPSAASADTIVESGSLDMSTGGAVTCAIAHGLGSAPALTDITLSCYRYSGSNDFGLRQIYVQSVDATNINVYVYVTATAATTYARVVARIAA